MSEIPMIVEFMEKIDGYREARLEQQSKLDSLTEAGVFLLTCMHELEAENERLNLVDTLYKELLEHEQQTHQVLGEILGTDDSLEVLARRVVERNKELEPLADIVLYNQRVLAEAGALNMSHECHIEGLNERIKELEAALQFYADCEWGWNGSGNYEPMILRLPDEVPNTLDCKFAGSVARAALEVTRDE